MGIRGSSSTLLHPHILIYHLFELLKCIDKWSYRNLPHLANIHVSFYTNIFCDDFLLVTDGLNDADSLCYSLMPSPPPQPLLFLLPLIHCSAVFYSGCCTLVKINAARVWLSNTPISCSLTPRSSLWCSCQGLHSLFAIGLSRRSSTCFLYVDYH